MQPVWSAGKHAISEEFGAQRLASGTKRGKYCLIKVKRAKYKNMLRPSRLLLSVGSRIGQTGAIHNLDLHHKTIFSLYPWTEPTTKTKEENDKLLSYMSCSPQNPVCALAHIADLRWEKYTPDSLICNSIHNSFHLTFHCLAVSLRVQSPLDSCDVWLTGESDP